MSDREHEERERLRLVYTAGSPAEASIVAAVIEEAGLFALVPDRHIPFPGVDLLPLEGEGRSSCQVLALESEAEQAREAIRDAREAGRVNVEGSSGEE